MHVAGSSADENYALAICKATGYPSGTVVPALARLTERALLTRLAQPTRTGRSRIVHKLTAPGRQYVGELLEQMQPRVVVLGQVKADPAAQLEKINISTVWLLAAAVSNGETYGYSPAMRPLTHQAAYAELNRLTGLGWFETVGVQHRLTTPGRRASVTLGSRWGPVLARAGAAIT